MFRWANGLISEDSDDIRSHSQYQTPKPSCKCVVWSGECPMRYCLERVDWYLVFRGYTMGAVIQCSKGGRVEMPLPNKRGKVECVMSLYLAWLLWLRSSSCSRRCLSPCTLPRDIFLWESLEFAAAIYRFPMFVQNIKATENALSQNGLWMSVCSIWGLFTIFAKFSWLEHGF